MQNLVIVPKDAFREASPEKCPKILGIAHLQGGGGVREFVE